MNLPINFVLLKALRSKPSAKRRKLQWSLGLFGFLLLFISAVSVHDAALVVLNEQFIREFESNPIGRWLIDINGGNIWLFVTTKLISTSVVCAALAATYEQTQQKALAISGSLAAFQALLLAYLSFA